MMLAVLILAVSLSLDAMGVGMVYGLRKILIPLPSKLFICLLSILYSGFALIVGKSISCILPPVASKLTGILILGAMGIWLIIQALFKKDRTESTISRSIDTEKTLLKIGIKSLGITIQIIKNPAEGDIDNSGTIDMKESFLLGLALSVDAIGVGIGSALSGFDSILIPCAVGFSQMVFIYIGTLLGRRFSLNSGINKKVLELLPGILLILLALMRL
ncbi:putative sporulation protein YtaF [Anaerobacterium chartisolvens]|uniref:Putative sporulation protein YtaF n=1 Tax=Anaerobacterium chartisolvens TaxID=1297424 RepID=A0A369BJY8_9FIRM|nr:sporulation membrane protein YtaF [Anaerobacterium chartisolvens]RCX20938.1 putative sporulation protein YtaF [Anaerobacterium chartisolvens]